MTTVIFSKTRIVNSLDKGFDTHADVEERLSKLFLEINDAFEAFSNEMKAQYIWHNVTLIQLSDFARTLSPNGGDGTDHAWGKQTNFGIEITRGLTFFLYSCVHVLDSSIISLFSCFLYFPIYFRTMQQVAIT